jgi:cytochrome c-type biogenesis protein
MNDSKARRFLLITLFVLLAAIVFGLFWFFFFGPKTSEIPVGFGWYIFSFAAGLSMIVLPCTLPLAFVIVPLSMGKGPFKGFLIALAFGLGIAITLSMYGVLAAVVGKVAIGSLGAPLELVKNWLYFVAGIFAYIFALGELGLVRFRMPSYTGAFPGFIQKQQDVLKALLLGLFLGNVGIGCPHPATPVILTRIAVSGDVFYGWGLFFIHAVGRVLPLLFLAILGILGVNALQSLVAKKDKIERATGWGMVFVAAFILCLGLFSHDWWVLSGQHTLIESLTQEEVLLNLLGNQIGVAGGGHAHEMVSPDARGLFGLSIYWGVWVMLALWILPLWWNFFRKRKEVDAEAEPDKTNDKKAIAPLFWNVVTLSLLLTLTFGYVLPHRFLEKNAAAHHEEGMPEMDHGAAGHTDGAMNMGHGDHSSMQTMTHEAASITEGLSVNLSTIPADLRVGNPATLDFFVNEKPAGTPIAVESLDVMHEKKMHVIGMRTDLSNFFHIHPQISGEGHMITIHTFTNPGEYKIWSEVTQDGMTHAIAQPLLTVEGNGTSFAVPAKDVNATSKIVSGYQAEFHHEEIFAGVENALGFTIKDADGNVVPLDSYLGAAMHLTIVSEDLNRYIHAHPEEGASHSHSLLAVPVAHADAGHESAVNFHVNFPAPGYYKLFAQIHPSGWAPTGGKDDAYLLAEYWVKVDAAPASATLSWSTKLWVSLVLMAILSFIVKRFIEAPDREPVVAK